MDITGRQLIAEGTTITLALIEEIRQEGVTFLQLMPDGLPVASEAPHVTTATPTTPPAKADDAADRAADASASPRLQPYSAERVEELERKFQACELAVGQMIDALRHGETVSADEAAGEIDEYAQELAEDPDPVVANALTYQPDLTLEKRCVQFSVLCMAIAIAQDVSPADVQNLGMAALMHDWSLFNVEPRARFARIDMTDEERYQFSKHPQASESLLAKVRGSNELHRLIVGQVHELMDGSGYPFGLTRQKIHPLSRIAGVADSFLTLTSPPPGVARVIPCDAIAYLIAAAAKGRYAPASVSALLEATTLFPLGSILELSDTTQVRVIRTNPGKYGYPIVQVVSDPKSIIDLSTSELFITRPVASTTYDEIRLPDTYKELNSSAGQ